MFGSTKETFFLAHCLNNAFTYPRDTIVWLDSKTVNTI